MRLLRIVLVAAALAMPAAHVMAQPADKPAAEAPASPQEAADEQAVRAALDRFEKDGYLGLAPHLPAVRAVLEHAPAKYPRVEKRGSVTVVRTDIDDTAATALMALLTAAGRGESTSVVQAFNTYPLASLLLGLSANEDERFEDAIAWLDRGLALQPDHTRLMSEKGYALNKLRRPADALAMYERGLKVELAPDSSRAIMLRGKGYALIELHRLDEAQAAYRESLKLEPNNQIALKELEYIAQERLKVR